MDNKKEILGQFFTKNNLLQKVISSFVLKKSGILLEPSIGAGDLVKKIEKRDILGFEIDNSISFEYADFQKTTTIEYGCFFEKIKNISTKQKNITTIVSNPPYVAWNKFTKDYSASQAIIDYKNDVNMNNNGNLAYLFMHKSAELLKADGELIFLVPKDFTVATSASFLRKYLKENGSITHWMEGREDNFFTDANLENMCIFRWQKSKNISKTLKYYQSAEIVETKQYEERNELYVGDCNIIFLVPNNYHKFLNKQISDFFNIKVGSVSALDPVYKNPPLPDSINILELYTSKDNKDKFLFVDENTVLSTKEKEYLDKHKNDLLKRYGINEKNVYQWATIRNKDISISKNKYKILVSAKTRDNKPFFIADENGFSGALYALIPKIDITKEELLAIVDILNSNLYKELFSSNGMGTPNKKGVKLKLIPNSLENLPFLDKKDWKNYSISLNYSYDQYRKLGKHVLETFGKEVFKQIKNGKQKEIEIDKSLSDDGRNISSLLDKKFHEKIINDQNININLINQINESLGLSSYSWAKVQKIGTGEEKRDWYDFLIEMDNGFVFFINTKHVEGKKSQWDNVSGNKGLMSYLLSGNPDSDTHARTWEDVLKGSLISFKNSLPDTSFVDYFIFEIHKKNDDSYVDFVVSSIFDDNVVKVNRAQGMPGLQFNSANKTNSIIDKVQSKKRVIGWCREWIEAYSEIYDVLQEINEIINTGLVNEK